MDLVKVLRSAVDQGCSDVHILVGKPPMMRQNGEIRPIDPSLPALTAVETKGLIYPMLFEDQRARFETSWELDSSYDLPGLSRFRVNVLLTLNGVEAVMRVIGAKIPDPVTPVTSTSPRGRSPSSSSTPGRLRSRIVLTS